MAPQKSESRDLDKVIVRLPDGMRDRVKAAADTNNRSMNAEIVARLEGSFAVNSSDDPAAKDIIRSLLRRISEPDNKDITLVGAEYNAVMYLSGFPTKDVSTASWAITQERLTRDPSFADAIPADYRAHAERWISEALRPVVRYMQSTGWMVEPPIPRKLSTDAFTLELGASMPPVESGVKDTVANENKTPAQIVEALKTMAESDPEGLSEVANALEAGDIDAALAALGGARKGTERRGEKVSGAPRKR